MSKPIPDTKHSFMGRFTVASGGVLNGEPIPDINFAVTALNPFVMFSVHMEPADAIRIGKALIEHGERMTGGAK